MTTPTQKANACSVCGRPLKDPISRQLGIGPVCRTKGTGIVTSPAARSHRSAGSATRPKALQQSLSTWKVEADDLPPADIDVSECPYRDHGGSACICHLRIWFRERYTVAMVTELPHNPGMSVTNAAEPLWRRLEEDYDLALTSPRILRIEHYPAEPDSRIEGCRGHRYDRVLFAPGVHWEPFGIDRVKSALTGRSASTAPEVLAGRSASTAPEVLAGRSASTALEVRR